MSCSNNITPCTSCGQTDACGCKTSTDEVVYQGPVLGCTGINNCDTLTTVFQTMDGFICGPDMVQTIINNITNNQSLFLQFMTIVNNSVDCETVWNCIENHTTTTTTTECPCTYYSFVGGRINPAQFTFIECGQLEPTTIQAGDIPEIYCVANHYSVIQVGNGVYNNTHDCCVAITTTTTTTLTLAYCYEAEIVNKCSVYWIDINGNPQVQSGTDTILYICAQPDTIVSACEEFGTVTITGGVSECSSEAFCAPTTSTTTTMPVITYCYDVDITNKCRVYWTDSNGFAQAQSGTNTTIHICAVPGSITAGCVEFGSINIEGGTVICTNETMCQPTTTSTTTLPHTTTTTTTVCPCQSYDVVVNSAELLTADGKTIYVSFDDCAGDSQQYEYTVAGTYPAAFCADQSKTPVEYYIKSGDLFNTILQPESTGCCTGKCTEYTVQAFVGDGTWTAIDCNGDLRTGTLIYPTVTVLPGCLEQGTLDLTNAVVVSEEDCTITTTTTTTVLHYTHELSAGKTNNVLACAETVPTITVYTSGPTIAFGSFVYTDPGLTVLFNGANLYYQNITANNGVRVNAGGQVNSTFSC